MVLSMFGGVAGGSHLWDISRQPLIVLGTEASPRFDTLRLGRKIKPGLVLGVSATIFRSAHLGISGEISFLGLSTDDDCTLVFESPGSDPFGRNAQVCGDISSHGASPTTVGFFLGGNYRVAPRAFATPYLRAQVGLGVRSGSTIETVGTYLDAGQPRRRIVILDNGGTRVLPSAGAAVGFMIPLGPGYQARLELRDQVLAMERVSGPADALATAPTITNLVHSVALSAAIDIVLEQRRGRRY